MKQPSFRKRARRLLKDLMDLQGTDSTITPPTIFAIKHLLQLNKSCKLIEVKIDSMAANCSFDSLRSFLPRFIVSQLEEQKLTERDSERVRIPPIVAFAIQSLPSASGFDTLYPTLFRWYYPPRHRTYYVFAYIKHSMARRTYTLTELLGLRANQASAEILAMAVNPEMGDIVRRAGSESSSGSGSNCRPATIRHKDDSSATSDELIFKGTINRRMGRELAQEASQNCIGPPARETARDTIRDIAPEPLHNPSRPMEWNYRGRGDTEIITAEPIPAPTGVSAQRDEGFQRFYKAVVSPTHVRVTAGGRIVPNTRGPPSPTTKRTSDNLMMDSQSVSDKAAASKPLPAPINLGQPVPVLPQLVTGYPPGFQQLQAPVSFVPMALPPGFSFTQAAVNSAAMAPLAPGIVLKDLHNSKTADDDKQAKPKAPAAEPFYYNGQIMYPVGAFPAPMGNHIVPFHMVGIPHGIVPQLPGHYVQQQPTQTSLTTTGSSHTPSNHGISGIPPVANHIVPANANINAASAPPISSIRPSDITRKQIASFKQNLKYHVDQLQYNRHQIDEKEMEQRIQIIQGHIQKFEATLKTQLEYEDAHIKTTQGKEDNKSLQFATASEEYLSEAPAVVPLGYRAPTIKQETDEAVNQRTALSTYGLNTSIGESGKVIFRSPAEQAFSNTNGLSNGASLPSDAALAPIFRPRGYASTWTGSKYAREMKAYEEAEKRLVAESKSLEHMRLGDQRSVSQPFIAPKAPAVQIQRNHDCSDNSGRSGGSGTKLFNFGVPYLLGTLPKGVNPRTARDQDYVYKRPLTEEERRARFLYWGKAPKSAVKGLPKFDGKHFYPPSPVKERLAEPARESDCRTTDSDGDPFRPMTPVQRVDPRGVSASEDNCTSSRLTRTISFETQVNSGSEDCITSGAPLRYREESVDVNSVDSVDRRSEIPGAKLWQAVLKKGPTSSALSSTTAQGFLPQYTGNAAASLTPALSTNQLSSNKDTPSDKFSDVREVTGNGGALQLTAPKKRGENCPPGVSSLEDQFKQIAVDARRNLTSGFNM